MKNKSTLSIPTPNAIKKAVLAFLHRFHIIIFVVVVLGGLGAGIAILNNTIAKSSQSDGYTSASATNTSFDQDTIKRIDELKTSNQSSDQLPVGVRINPFVE